MAVRTSGPVSCRGARPVVSGAWGLPLVPGEWYPGSDSDEGPVSGARGQILVPDLSLWYPGSDSAVSVVSVDSLRYPRSVSGGRGQSLMPLWPGSVSGGSLWSSVAVSDSGALGQSVVRGSLIPRVPQSGGVRGVGEECVRWGLIWRP
ncbi:hypothetical protein NDU88_003937 [Pleurodeles waltl]|uniref:Uncharacterized protein n=1 Tax=Pleurodeles waltl TaxID=8319 RepID=A0AAV7T6S1_PLEWA|nr:hypothetical protein NDU88_003937 [Pleurodeles waltl]